jgi:hypothetical protein
LVAGRFAQIHPQIETKAIQVIRGAAGKTNLYTP